MQTSKTFSISEALNYGWETFKKQPVFWIVIGLISYVVNGAGTRYTANQEKSDVSTFTIESPFYEYTGDLNIDVAPETFITFGLVFLVLFVVFAFINMGIQLGITRLVLDAVHDKALKYSTIISQFDLNKIWLGFRIGLVYGLLIILGIILLVVPGVYWAIKYQFVIFSMLDKKTNFSDSFKMSAKLTEGVKTKLLLFGLVEFVIFFLASFTIIGLFIVSPIFLLAQVYLYKKLSKGVSVADITS